MLLIQQTKNKQRVKKIPDCPDCIFPMIPKNYDLTKWKCSLCNKVINERENEIETSRIETGYKA